MRRRTYIEPLKTLDTVRPLRLEDLAFSASQDSRAEIELMHSLANEHVIRGGTEMLWYSLDVSSSVVDPLYGEAGYGRSWRGPYKVKGWVESPDSNPEIREEGMKVFSMPQAWVPRSIFDELGIPYPMEGDVVQIWPGIDYYRERPVNKEAGLEVAGFFFNVIDVDDDAHIFDNPEFLGFKLTLARNTEFAPERRVLGP